MNTLKFAGRSVPGFGLGADEDIDALVAAKLAEGGYPNVSAYQQANGLKVDGDAGHETLTAMGYGHLFDLTGKLKPWQTQLETKNTPLTPEEAAQALSAGYQAVIGSVPTPEVLALLLAQSGHETADWSKMPNYSFGGVKDFGQSKYVQAFITTEGDPPKRYVSAFAAYPSAMEGAEAYVSALRARTNWWNGLQSGTPEGFIAGLTVRPYAYFTGNAEQYLARVQNRVDRFADLARTYARQLSTPIIDWPVVPPTIRDLKDASEVAIYALSALALAVAAGYAAQRERKRAR